MTEFTDLSSELTELIFSHLPIPSLVHASTVCKLWHSIIRSPFFSATHNHIHRHRPWLFLYAIHSTTSENNQAFAFDPLSNRWFRLPFPIPQPKSCFLDSNGYFFTTAPQFKYAQIFKRTWISTSPLKFSRISPLLGVFQNGSSEDQFIVVGGVKFMRRLLDPDDALPVGIYNSRNDFWEICPPLPAYFRSGNSSYFVSSAVFGGKFYIFSKTSFFICSFDLLERIWSEVQTLRPPGIIYAYLIACSDRLLLAGLRKSRACPSFVLWEIEVETMEFKEISIMPNYLLYSLINCDERYKYWNLISVGLGNLVYVFNYDRRRKYPACVFEISHTTSKCRWRRIPQLPFSVNEIHEVLYFSSTVSLHNILGLEEEGEGTSCRSDA